MHYKLDGQEAEGKNYDSRGAGVAKTSCRARGSMNGFNGIYINFLFSLHLHLHVHVQVRCVCALLSQSRVCRALRPSPPSPPFPLPPSPSLPSPSPSPRTDQSVRRSTSLRSSPSPLAKSGITSSVSLCIGCSGISGLSSADLEGGGVYGHTLGAVFRLVNAHLRTRDRDV